MRAPTLARSAYDYDEHAAARSGLRCPGHRCYRVRRLCARPEGSAAPAPRQHGRLPSTISMPPTIWILHPLDVEATRRTRALLDRGATSWRPPGHHAKHNSSKMIAPPFAVRTVGWPPMALTTPIRKILGASGRGLTFSRIVRSLEWKPLRPSWGSP